MSQECSKARGPRDTTNQRKAALLRGDKKYSTGLPCLRGHLGLRYTSSGLCTVCEKQRSRRRDRSGYIPDPVKVAKYRKKWNNSAKGKAVKLKWRRNNAKRAWASTCVSQARLRANKYSVPFNITKEYVLSITPDKCPVFGTPFMFMGNKRPTDRSATLDRLVPTLGYVRGNVVVVSMKANRIKSAYAADDVLLVGSWFSKVRNVNR